MENLQNLSCNVSELETKISAFSHILKVAMAMGTQFEPYVEMVLPVMIQHLGFTSRTVRKQAMKTLEFLLIAKGEPMN